MDIVCIVFGIIDLCKPSMALSIVATCVGIIEVVLLTALNKNKDKQPWLAYAGAFFCIAVGVIKICVL